jgi:predicted CXXCH cytochrome family protein
MRIAAIAFCLAATTVFAQEGPGPLPPKVAVVSSHAPFEAGDCSLCHKSADPKAPGPVTKASPGVCLECHEEFNAVLKRPHVHAAAQGDCTSCHNPHNARQPKLLRDTRASLCTTCHADIGKAMNGAVKHQPVSAGAQCTTCHDPHGAAIEKLLVRQPFELCMGCHDKDGLVGPNGRKLQNIKAWLDQNKEWHGPVAMRDCSGCHQPHGGDHFRLLKEEYPAEFYAGYSPRLYALCLSCHREEAFSTAQTTTLTDFRDGSRNLHYVHLQQPGKGRTCRACHEVHASKQEHHIRDGVPYGSSGWILKLNYKKTATGGSCDKTCHGEKAYSNGAARR